MLRPEELELIICGTQMLDFKELEKSARYDDGFEKSSETIQNLWEVVHSLTDEEKKKFLFFLTGCDRAPINGLGKYI
jgi:ubiquitin-protein ligase E3 A